MMNTINTKVLNLTISIIDDTLQRKTLPEILGVGGDLWGTPYFAFLSVLHLRESLGLRGPEHIYT